MLNITYIYHLYITPVIFVKTSGRDLKQAAFLVYFNVVTRCKINMQPTCILISSLSS